MDNLAFEKMQARAKILRITHPDKADYISGYLQGLARAHHGEDHAQQDHDRLTAYATLDPSLQGSEKNIQIGLGYLDGLKAKPLGHGGPGRRSAADGATGLMRKNIMIDPSSADILKALGGGDLSLGIRRAAAQLAPK